MKLLKLTLEGSYKGLRDQTFDFSCSSENIITFVGLNGSGKSQLLELIAEVFGYLERARRPDFKTRSSLPYSIILEYQLRPYLEPDDLEAYQIDIKASGKVECQALLDNEWHSKQLHEIELPQHVVGYASGLNENLQRSFLKNAVQYFDVMSVRANRRVRLAGDIDEAEEADINEYYLKRHPGIFGGESRHNLDEPDQAYIFEKDTDMPASIYLDYDCNALLMASLAILRNDILDKIFPDISYRYPRSIRLEYDFRGIPFEEDAIRDISQLINYVGADAVTGISQRTTDDEYDMYSLEYLAASIYINLENGNIRELLSEQYYGLPIRFFEKLYKIQLLGVKFWRGVDKTKLRDDAFFGTIKKPLKGILPLTVTELKLSNGENVIDFDDLSDGEAQLVQVLSAAYIFSPDNTLFIFDEPETHLNPSWRTQFHKHLISAMGSDGGEVNPRLQIMLSTHSPFLVSSLKKENVFRFERNENGVVMSPVGRETYGTSFDVLIKDFFELKSLISQTAVDDIKRQLDNPQLTNEQKSAWLEENVGDSMEKAYLLRRLQE